MVKNLAMKPFQSSFLSCEKDAEIILRKLFIESRPYSDDLKRLLVINTRDCLDDKTNPIYLKKIEEMNLQKLVEQGYIGQQLKVNLQEFEEVKSRIIINFDKFSPNVTNPEFRDCNIIITILSHFEVNDLGNYRRRDLKIAGFIDGILQNSRLTGIGTLQLLSGEFLPIDEEISGYSLIYRAIHGSDDKIPESDKIV